MTKEYRNRLLHAIWAFRFGRCDELSAEETLQVLAGAAERLLAENEVTDEPVLLTATSGHCDGWAVHPENGRKTGVRCPHGCPSRCSVCSNPNCDNPGGQH